MSKPTFTFPGKLGDTLMQWPVAAQFLRQKQVASDLWLDAGTCAPLVSLLSAQPFVDKVELKPGIDNYNCGGQPWHFNLKTSDFKGRAVYHMGFRNFPQRQITLETAESVNLPINIDRSELAAEPSLIVDSVETKNRVVLHGSPIFKHNRQTPQFWKFLSGIADELEEEFDELVFVGDDRDREMGLRTYPEWSSFDDHGDFLDLARLVGGSRLVIGVGSCVVALADCLKIPAVRVHDQIGAAPKVIWSGLGENQINEDEPSLRTEWPRFKDKWLRVSEVVSG